MRRLLYFGFCVCCLLVPFTEADSVPLLDDGRVYETLNPECENFYEFNCAKHPSRVSNARLRALRFLKMSDEVDQFQEYVFATREPARSIWEMVDPDLISKWLVQFDTYRDGTHWAEHKKRHDEFLKLNEDEKQRSLVDLITRVPFETFSNIYKSLKKSVEYLTELKIPVSTKNHFYHGLFNEIKEMHISEIKRYSKYTEAQRQELIDRINNLKVIFPYLEYNNVTVWRQAKTGYEQEYYRLKQVVNETEIQAETVEKILRIAAVEPALKLFEQYMKEFTPRFIFQHINAAATRDSFNYQNEVHVSVFTMINPDTHPDEVYNQFLFVLNHEIQHAHFHVDPPTFEPTIWEAEKNCLIGELDRFSGNFKQKNPDWSMSQYYYEDMANVAGMRLFVLYHAQKTSDDQKIRDAIEKSMSMFCTTNVANKVHNPHDVSINVAVSQIPNFNKLYNCTPGNKMYVSEENRCRTLNMYIDGNDFTPQKITEKELETLAQFMDVLEDTAIELDAANITTFEGELFDITVEDVEEKEEELEGSAESSSSSESDEGDDLKENDLTEIEGEGDDDDEIRPASSEIVASSRTLSSFGLLVVLIGTLLLNF